MESFRKKAVIVRSAVPITLDLLGNETTNEGGESNNARCCSHCIVNEDESFPEGKEALRLNH